MGTETVYMRPPVYESTVDIYTVITWVLRLLTDCCRELAYNVVGKYKGYFM